MNFKQWLKLDEVGTMASGVTGGMGDIATFKQPLLMGMVRRTWPDLQDDRHSKKHKKKKS